MLAIAISFGCMLSCCILSQLVHGVLAVLVELAGCTAGERPSFHRKQQSCDKVECDYRHSHNAGTLSYSGTLYTDASRHFYQVRFEHIPPGHVVPWTHNSFGDRSFGAVGPLVWNSLPSYLRQDISYKQFKRLLKTFLFGRWLTAAHCDYLLIVH